MDFTTPLNSASMVVPVGENGAWFISSKSLVQDIVIARSVAKLATSEAWWKQTNLTLETLSPEQIYDEYVMLRLRTMWGIDLKYMKREMGERFSNYCEQQAQPLIGQGRLCQTREFLYLTDEQMLFADGVAAELFWS